MIFESKWREAKNALSDGKQALALNEIADIFKAINPKYGDESAVKDGYETFILCMSKSHRISNLYNTGQLNITDYLYEIGKLDSTVHIILNDLATILQKISRNKIEIIIDEDSNVAVKIPEGYIFEEQQFLEIVQKIAIELGIDVEILLLRNLKK